MSVASVIVSALLAAVLVWSALRKLSHQPEVVASYERAGVPENRLNLLATTLLAGAAGLVAGLFWAPLGTAAAAALVAYFLVAVSFHVRAGDTAHMATPLVLAAVAAVALTLLSLSA